MSDLASNALVETKEFKMFRGIEADDPNYPDDRLISFINAASQTVEDYCHRVFRSSSSSEIHNGDGTPNLFVVNKPITTLSRLEYWDGSSWATLSTSSYSYEYDSATGEIWRDDGSVFVTGTKNYRVVYSHGYALDDVPNDLKQSVCQYIQRLMLSADGKEGLSSESTEAGQTNYDLAMIPLKIKVVWDRYGLVIF